MGSPIQLSHATVSHVKHNHCCPCQTHVLQTSFHPQVTILVSDINDNSPEFLSSIITLTVSEGLPVGATVFNFVAIDEDVGSNGKVEYSIESEQVAALGE